MANETFLVAGIKKKLFVLFQRIVGLLWGTGLSHFPPIFRLYIFLFKALKPSGNVMVVDGHKMYCRMEGLSDWVDEVFQGYMVRGGWEEETTRLFKSIVKEGDVVVDLGANVGWYTLLSARVVGSEGRVYAFEPDATNYKLLVGNVELNNFANVITENQAVSDKTGIVNLYRTQRGLGATLCPSDNQTNIIPIKSTSLDDYFKGNKCRVNIVKMDIEGGERAALSGMTNIMKMNRGLKIFAEFHLQCIINSGTTPKQFASLLLNHYKFTITIIQDWTRHAKSQRVTSVDELLDICRDDGVVNLLLEG